MKAERFDATDAKRILTGMITDATVASRIARRWPSEGLFASRWENIIGGWCVEHARKYGKAPGRDIETIFRGVNLTNADEIASIERLLIGLSDAYEMNGSAPAPDYIMDLAGRLFKRVDLRRRAEAVLADLEQGEVSAAEQRMAEFRAVEFGPGSVDAPDAESEYWHDVFDDEEAMSLIQMPDGMAEFWRGDLCRDAFVAFLASEKRGKSWILLDMLVRGFRQRRRVAFFSVGDMSRNQVGRRLGRRLLGAPKRSGHYDVPVRWVGGSLPECEEQYIEGVTPGAAYAAARRMGEGKGRMRIMCYPAATINAEGIEGVLMDWAQEGWVADIVIIDYADILAPPAGVLDGRDQINVNWMHLRRMSSNLHCLLITATQANAKSYTADILGRHHFSEDKRKYSHVTAMIGINQSWDERSKGIYRFNSIMRREEEGNAVLTVAGNLDLGSPVMLAKLPGQRAEAGEAAETPEERPVD